MFGPDKAVITKDEAKAILARSAVIGFGRSAGRDIYRISTKPVVILAAFAFLGARYAVYDLQCTKKRSPYINWLMIAGSSLITLFAIGMTGSIVAALAGTLLIQGVSASVGARAAREDIGVLEHQAAIESANLAFLDAEGFRDVGGRQGTVIDRFGNELIPDDQRSDAFVFRILGRRSVRAYIWLDDEGRMVEYEPPGTQVRSPQVPATQAKLLDEPEHDAASHPLDRNQAAELLSRINDKTYVVVQEMIHQARGDHAGLLWDEISELTGYRTWAGFDRGVRWPLHRELRDITGEANAALLVDSNDTFDEADKKEMPRYVYIDGPAVSALQSAFASIASRHPQSE